MGNTSNPREENGKEIATKPDQIKRIDDNWYQVKAQSLKQDSWYDVIITEKGRPKFVKGRSMSVLSSPTKYFTPTKKQKRNFLKL